MLGFILLLFAICVLEYDVYMKYNGIVCMQIYSTTIQGGDKYSGLINHKLVVKFYGKKLVKWFVR